MARIEAFEEAGVDGIVTAEPMGAYEYVKDRGQRSARRGHAEVYAIEVTHERQVWKEMHQRERRWVSATEAAVLVCETDLSRLLTDVSLRSRSSSLRHRGAMASQNPNTTGVRSGTKPSARHHHCYSAMAALSME